MRKLVEQVEFFPPTFYVGGTADIVESRCGEGAYGIVHRARSKDGSVVALKQLKITGARRRDSVATRKVMLH